MDGDPRRAARFSAHYSVPIYRTLEELLDDHLVEAVLNLTNPRSHFSVSEVCLLRGKHVYSEKPLAMTVKEAEHLINLADQRGLYLSGAPSRLLGAPAQTMWKLLREGAIGTVRLAYAEMDDGLVHLMNYKRWVSESGAHWPYKDEFETGCTVEHAGYALTWLAAFFGPAESVTAFASSLVPDKKTDVTLDVQAPDFSVACIRFASGPVARLTCSIVAPRDHSIRIFGDAGTLSTDDCWKPRSPVRIRRRTTFRGRSIELPWRSRIGLLGSAALRRRLRRLKKVDFCLGPAELAAAVEEGRPCRLSARFCLHITELTLAIHNAMETGAHTKLSSSFDPIEPMPWAQ
jgi:predicted dehydrogenase